MTRKKQKTRKTQKNRKKQQTLEEKIEQVKNFRPIDDTFFEVLADDIGVCQEMLRIILEDEKLIVKDVIVQSSERNLYGRSVRLDALCILGNGKKCNVEVQRSNKDHHLKRVRFNASVTVEAVSTGKISISCKGKHREIYLVHKLKMKLLDYCKKKGIRSGAVFITKNGNPVDRSNIWTEMKKNAEKAGVALEKAFPHNLRHFFARVYYSIHKNISQLADILGHSSINTTRIYLATTEEDHVKKLERLDLVV